MSDFSGQAQLKYTWVIDEGLNLTTITIADSADVPLGTIVIENNRARSFLESLATMAKEFFPDTETSLQGAKTNLNKNAGTAVLDFG